MQPVVIVGAGPTGLVLAIELARRNVACRIVDRLAAPLTFARASSIMPRTLEILATMGVLPAFVARGVKIHTVATRIGGRQVARLPLDMADSPYPYILALGQQETERILSAHLAGYGVTVERDLELVAATETDRGVRCLLRSARGEENWNAAWLVGCDGAHSQVREAMGVELEGVDYPESQILGLLKIDHYPFAHDVLTVFTEGDWSFLIQRFPDDHYFLAGNATDDGSPETDNDAALLAAWQWRLDRVAPGARAHEPLWLSRFFLHNRHAERYRRDRMLLAGDAAHLFSPVTGEGMNTGMQDAFNLGWKLALVARGEAPASLLDSYTSERRQAAIEIGAVADQGEREREISDPVLQAQRNRALAAEVPPLLLREAVASHTEIAHSYRSSPLSSGFHGNRRSRHHHVEWCGPWPGDRLPDAFPLIDPAGAQRSLYDLAWRERLTLVILAGMADSALIQRHQELADAVANRFGATVETLLIVQADAPPCAPGFAGQVVADAVDSAHGRLGVLADTLLLVRPDGYVGFRSEPPDRHALFRALQGILGARAGSGRAGAPCRSRN